ncbi:hypothetical protein BDN72DRAFT_906459 [Pluteus cervinus]|uniref:Uncharacterized protein n=1 Tax=Pluteus cervinus TaxID=181527 RepID=A0ACD2ZZ75_9AGAR|nr:hypothetical protein BDN72DRAFT_906459 [Pluteus cervinus]
MIRGQENTCKTISISPCAYLPGLVGATDYTFTCPRKFSYGITEISSDFVRARAIEAIHQWLCFQHEPEIALQVGIIDILTLQMKDITLLFLTPVREILQLDMMRFCFARHQISDPSTAIGSSIQQLQRRIVEWTRPPKPANAQKRPPKRKASKSGTNASPASPLVNQLHITLSEDYRAEFITFVRRLSVFLDNTGSCDKMLACNSKDALAKKVAKNVDHYLPFRQCAPTMSSAMSIAYANIDRLQTKTVCGTSFVTAEFSSARLDSKESWSAIHDAETKGMEEEEIETHFVKKNASGQSIVQRKLSLVAEFYNAILGEKNEYINQQILQPNWQALFNHFGQFSSVGSLISLLILGDLIECSLLLPSINEWATLIRQANAGAADGLVLLRMVDGEPGRKKLLHQILSGFIQLDDLMKESFNEEERRKMGHDIIMSEHALCKFKRSPDIHLLVPQIT